MKRSAGPHRQSTQNEQTCELRKGLMTTGNFIVLRRRFEVMEWQIWGNKDPITEILYTSLRRFDSTLWATQWVSKDLKYGSRGTSLVVQRLRPHLPVHQVQVRSLLGELRTYMPLSQQNINNRSNIVTNSIKTLKKTVMEKTSPLPNIKNKQTNKRMVIKTHLL